MNRAYQKSLEYAIAIAEEADRRKQVKLLSKKMREKLGPSNFIEVSKEHGEILYKASDGLKHESFKKIIFELENIFTHFFSFSYYHYTG